MAKKLQRQLISLKEGRGSLDEFLSRYHARYYPTSSTDKGQLFWSAPVAMWMLVMMTKVRNVPHAQVTFHAKDNCPCQII